MLRASRPGRSAGGPHAPRPCPLFTNPAPQGMRSARVPIPVTDEQRQIFESKLESRLPDREFETDPAVASRMQKNRYRGARGVKLDVYEDDYSQVVQSENTNQSGVPPFSWTGDGLGSECLSGWSPFECDRAEVADTGVAAARIVETVDVVEDRDPRVAVRAPAAAVNQLRLQGGEE